MRLQTYEVFDREWVDVEIPTDIITRIDLLNYVLRKNIHDDFMTRVRMIVAGELYELKMNDIYSMGNESAYPLWEKCQEQSTY